MTFPPLQQVTGLLGFESRKYICPFIFMSITFPVHIITLEKWTKELDWPTQVLEVTLWVSSHETISSSPSIRWMENIRVLGGGTPTTTAMRRGQAWGIHALPPGDSAQHDAEAKSEARKWTTREWPWIQHRPGCKPQLKHFQLGWPLATLVSSSSKWT